MKFFKKAASVVAALALVCSTGCASNAENAAGNINRVSRNYGATASNWNNRVTTSIKNGVTTNGRYTGRAMNPGRDYNSDANIRNNGNAMGYNRLNPSATVYPARTSLNGTRTYSYPTTAVNRNTNNRTTAVNRAMNNTTTAVNRAARNTTAAVNPTVNNPVVRVNNTEAGANRTVVGVNNNINSVNPRALTATPNNVVSTTTATTR